MVVTPSPNADADADAVSDAVAESDVGPGSATRRCAS